MKKPGIIGLIVLLLLVIIIIIVRDLKSDRTGSRPGNKYELDMGDYLKVDPSLIGYKEIRNYNIGDDSPDGIACWEQKIYLAADSILRIFNLEGDQLLKIILPYGATCLDISEDGEIITGFRNRIGLFNNSGELLWVTDTLNSRAYITAIAIKGKLIFVADAGNRVVHRYDISGRYLDNFESQTGENDSHGFIVPSGYFDLKINSEGELWVVNPGKHAFENYTDEGNLRGFWENSSTDIEGFSGCCNPAHIAFLPDGSFVTSEKLIVRIKVHKPSGEFLSVVAPPEKFKENGIAPDLAVDDDGNIYALDFDRKMIRVFALK
jgi:sugar lactone lactonase YvrE